MGTEIFNISCTYICSCKNVGDLWPSKNKIKINKSVSFQNLNWKGDDLAFKNISTIHKGTMIQSVKRFKKRSILAYCLIKNKSECIKSLYIVFLYTCIIDYEEKV